MPRSGSTLVEQILASHSRVGGVGEVTLLEQAGKSLVRRGWQEQCLEFHVSERNVHTASSGQVRQPLSPPARPRRAFAHRAFRRFHPVNQKTAYRAFLALRFRIGKAVSKSLDAQWKPSRKGGFNIFILFVIKL